MDTSVYLGVIFYRILTILCGFGFAYLGYRLFCLGITKEAGELQAKYGDSGLMLRQVAPGVFFALFGVIIAAVGIYRGVDFTQENTVGVGVAVSGKPGSVVGELFKIDPELDLDNHPQRMLDIIEKLKVDGHGSLDNQEKELLKIYVGKLKARIRAKTPGTES